MITFTQENSLISKQLSDFKKNSSANLAIFDLDSNNISSFSSEEYCVFDFLDLKNF